MKDATGASNHITLVGITDPSAPPSQFHIANGESLSMGTEGIVEPMLQVISTSEQGGGDGATSWLWSGSMTGGDGAVVNAEQLTVEDLSGEQISVLAVDPTRNPQITIGLTSSNCDGSASASALTFTITP